jgi:hypothetical protein
MIDEELGIIGLWMMSQIVMEDIIWMLDIL